MNNKAHILAVDDDPDILQMFKRALEPEGYSVDVAVDGKSAMALLIERKPDLVLLDILMPRLNGYQVLGLIRQQSDVPVIMVTAVQEAASVQKALGIGADDYVRKPFYIQELLGRVKMKLKRAGKFDDCGFCLQDEKSC